MAYAYTVSAPTIEVINGRKHVTVTVAETDVAPDEMCPIPVPEFFTITLFEAAITNTGGGSIATIDPELFLADSATPDSLLDTLDEVSTTTTAAAHHRVQSDVRVAAPNKQLYLRSKPNADGSATSAVSTRITWVEGHSV